MPSKRDLYKSYGEKLIGLFVHLLFSGEHHSLTELSNIFDCSKQTVLRLINNIRKSYGITIEETKQGNRSFFRIKKAVALTRDIPLTEAELQALQMCKAFTQHLIGKKLYAEATHAIFKSKTALADGKQIDECHFTAFRPGTIDYTPQHKIIHTLIEAMEKQKVCKLTYQAIDAYRPKTYHIKPLKLFSYQDAIYLHAQKAKEPGKRYRLPKYDPLLAVHRMKSVDMTDIDFQPDKFDFEKTFNQHFGVIKDEVFEVEVVFNGWAAAFVQERRWSPKQEFIKKSRSEIILKFTTSSKPEFIKWLLSFGAEARLIKPDWLVKDVNQIIGEMRKQYHTEEEDMTNILEEVISKLKSVKDGCCRIKNRKGWFCFLEDRDLVFNPQELHKTLRQVIDHDGMRPRGNELLLLRKRDNFTVTTKKEPYRTEEALERFITATNPVKFYNQIPIRGKKESIDIGIEECDSRFVFIELKQWSSKNSPLYAVVESLKNLIEYRIIKERGIKHREGFKDYTKLNVMVLAPMSYYQEYGLIDDSGKHLEHKLGIVKEALNKLGSEFHTNIALMVLPLKKEDFYDKCRRICEERKIVEKQSICISEVDAIPELARDKWKLLVSSDNK